MNNLTLRSEFNYNEHYLRTKNRSESKIVALIVRKYYQYSLTYVPCYQRLCVNIWKIILERSKVK